MSDAFESRARALEDQFFHQKDQELLDKLRKNLASHDAREALRAASGIDDETVLDELVSMNIRAESLAALSLLPLIAVAWADGKMEAKEKQAILKAASDKGIQEDSVAMELITAWNAMRPGPELLGVWKEYVHALKDTMDADAFGKLKGQIMSQALGVAEAAGGIMGMVNKVSPIEQAKLQELEQAFN